MAKPTRFELEKLQTAQQHGFSFFLINGDDKNPPFLYTVGMAQKGLPDVLMFLDSTYVQPQMAMVVQVLQHMVSGLDHFTPEALTASMHGLQKTVTDPEITYHFEVLSPSDNDKAVHDYACRCHFFRRILGDPQIVVISSDFNPSWKEIKQLEVA